MSTATGGFQHWRPLLDGVLQKQSHAALDAVAASISSRCDDPSLAGGAAGLAVFYRYLGHARSERRHTRTAARFLHQAVESVGSTATSPSLYSGLFGVAWATVHLQRTPFQAESKVSTRSIDSALKNYVGHRGWLGDYDLVSGLVGLGVYALERWPSRASLACLEGVVDRLDETATRESRGITWRTTPDLLPDELRQRFPRGYFDLGVAHGVPGAIAMLSAAYAAGVRRRKARRLLTGAVAWLLGQKLRRNAASVFPARIGPDIPTESSRSAWCYGDPGIAATLFGAARAAKEPTWAREALAIARRAAARPADDTGVVDACLCHGAAGLGHIFNRLYQATGDESLGRAAREWFERTLAMPQRDATDIGVLMGSSGIALALLAASTALEPAWDRMLLLTTPTFG